MQVTDTSGNTRRDSIPSGHGNFDRVVEEALPSPSVELFHPEEALASIRQSLSRVHCPDSPLFKLKDQSCRESPLSTHVQDSVAPSLTVKSDTSEERFVDAAYSTYPWPQSFEVQCCNTHNDIDGDREPIGPSAGRLQRPFDKAIEIKPHEGNSSPISEATSMFAPTVEAFALDAHCHSSGLTASSG